MCVCVGASLNLAGIQMVQRSVERDKSVFMEHPRPWSKNVQYHALSLILVLHRKGKSLVCKVVEDSGGATSLTVSVKMH